MATHETYERQQGSAPAEFQDLLQPADMLDLFTKQSSYSTKTAQR